MGQNIRNTFEKNRTTTTTTTAASKSLQSDHTADNDHELNFQEGKLTAALLF